MNILVTGAYRLSPSQLSELTAAGHQVFLHPDERTLVDGPEQYEAVICNGLFLYNNIERFLNLRLIQLTSVGFDRVPLDYIRAHGVELHNAARVYSIPMAEFAIGGILQFYKQSNFFAENQKLRKWEKHRGLLELSGKHICVLGCGNVGLEIAKRLKAFGCRITGVNRTVREFANFDTVLHLNQLPYAVAECDVLICCIALTEQTHSIINNAIFEILRPGAIFINIARGAILDETALIAWLQSGGFAVLDVFEEEPLSKDSPLWEMDNVIITPHNSFVGDRTTERLWEKIKALFIGEHNK